MILELEGALRMEERILELMKIRSRGLCLRLQSGGAERTLQTCLNFGIVIQLSGHITWGRDSTKICESE